MLIGGNLELFRGLFVGLLTNLPDLGLTVGGERVYIKTYQRGKKAQRKEGTGEGEGRAEAHLMYPAICKRESAVVWLSVGHGGRRLIRVP